MRMRTRMRSNQTPTRQAPSTQADPLSERDHRRVARYIEQVAGIQLPSAKRSLIEGRLRKRQRATGHASLHAYIDHVLESADGAGERLYLLDALTTNKTEFYREASHFTFLRKHITQDLAGRRLAGWKRPLRIWSAGCSSGEEPYTLAMEMLEMRRQHPGFSCDILATDISVSSLQKARKGVYPHERIEPVPMELRRRYLLRSRDKASNLVSMAPELRQKIRFDTFNLLTDRYEFRHPFDAIFCRNVMIYFNNEDRAQIVHNFAQSLSHDGLLFIGHSETLSGHHDGFAQQIPAVYKHTPGRR